MRFSLAVLSLIAGVAAPASAFAADYPEDYSYRDHGSYERSYDRPAYRDEPSYEERVVVRRPPPVVEERVYVERPAPVVYVRPRWYGPRFYGPRPVYYGPRWGGPHPHWDYRRW